MPRWICALILAFSVLFSNNPASTRADEVEPEFWVRWKAETLSFRWYQGPGQLPQGCPSLLRNTQNMIRFLGGRNPSLQCRRVGAVSALEVSGNFQRLESFVAEAPGLAKGRWQSIRWISNSDCWTFSDLMDELIPRMEMRNVQSSINCGGGFDSVFFQADVLSDEPILR